MHSQRPFILTSLIGLATLLRVSSAAAVAMVPESFSEVARAAKPAVVNIFSTRTVRPQGPTGDPNDPFNEFFRRFFGEMKPQRQQSLGSGFMVSKDGYIVTAAIPARRVIGCVVHLNASTPEPGLVVHRMGNGLIVGEPDGSASARVQQVAHLLARAGFDVTTSPRIQNDIWYKLWGNLTFNPISALTGAAGDRILDDPLVMAFCTAAMEEAARIGERIGCAIRQTPQERHAVTRRLGAFRTSMLQDAEAGRPLEIDAIVGAAKEIGERVGVATPTIDALLGLVRLFGRTRGLYPEAPR